jgi:glycosyltransferase involved in cell wall biosynthesis
MFSDPSDVIIFGSQSQQKKLDLMSRAHALLVPGVREGWGLVVTEANAMGTPAVAYNVPGLRDSVTDGITGKLVKSGDYLGMAVETIELLQNHIRRKTFSKNAMNESKHYDWAETASQIYGFLIGAESKRLSILH